MFLLLEELPSDEDVKLIGADLEIFKAVKQHRLMELGNSALASLRDRFTLTHFFNYFVGFNKANFAPYHNTYHAYCVVKNCYEGSYYEYLDAHKIRALLAGALFHDFNHSAGQHDDDHNIKAALEGLENAQKYATSNGTALSPDEYGDACKVIKITRYPFIHDPQLRIEQIMRDADLMQPYEPSNLVLYKQFSGLKQEVEVRDGCEYTDYQFGTGNKKFYDENVHWFTLWAKEKALVRDWETQTARMLQVFLTFRT